jgi:hypothetical protein
VPAPISGLSPTRPQPLVRHPAGGGSGGEPAGPVEGDDADGAVMPVRRRRRSAALGGPRAFELLPSPLRVEVLLGHEPEPLHERELFRALAGEQHVRGSLHHEAGEHDGVAHASHAGDCACSERLAVHDRGIELVAAFVGEDGALAGVEELGVLQDADGRDDGIEGVRAALELGVARIERTLEIGAIRRLARGSHLRGRQRAGASVQCDGDGVLLRACRGVRTGSENTAGEKSGAHPVAHDVTSGEIRRLPA